MRRPKLSSRRGGRDDTTRWLPVPCFHPHFREPAPCWLVHYEIRLFGLLKALQSSDRSLLLDEGGLSSLAQSPLDPKRSGNLRFRC